MLKENYEREEMQERRLRKTCRFKKKILNFEKKEILKKVLSLQ